VQLNSRQCNQGACVSEVDGVAAEGQTARGRVLLERPVQDDDEVLECVCLLARKMLVGTRESGQQGVRGAGFSKVRQGSDTETPL
jgi:hypothetical protein